MYLQPSRQTFTVAKLSELNSSGVPSKDPNAFCAVVQNWKQADRLHLEQRFSQVQAVHLHRKMALVSQEKN